MHAFRSLSQTARLRGRPASELGRVLIASLFVLSATAGCATSGGASQGNPSVIEGLTARGVEQARRLEEHQVELRDRVRAFAAPVFGTPR